MADPDYIAAYKHSIRHRDEIERSNTCGCFCCIRLFPPSLITNWYDEPIGVGQTAFCPYCGIDSVIGSASGYPITREFLASMQKHWFGVRGTETKDE